MEDKDKNKNYEDIRFHSDYEENDELIQNGIVRLETYNSALGIINWGANNLLPLELRALYETAGVHSNLIKRKANMIGGNGWNYSGLNVDSLAFLNNNGYSEDSDEILNKISFDCEIFGGYCEIITWDDTFSFIEKREYTPIEDIRIAATEDGIITGYKKHPDWASISGFSFYTNNFAKQEPEFFPKFSKFKKTKSKRQIRMCKVMKDNPYNYPIPYYYPALETIQTTALVPAFWKNGLINQFRPGLIITLPYGIPDEKTQDQIVTGFMNKYKGVTKVGKPMISFAEDKDRAPIIEPIRGNDDDNSYTQMTETNERILYQSHGIVDKTLFSVEIAGSLGATNDLAQGLAIFQGLYINTIQKIIEESLNHLAKINGINEEFKINRYTIPNEKVITLEEILQITQTTLSPEIKINILIYAGMKEEDAKKIVEQNDI